MSEDKRAGPKRTPQDRPAQCTGPLANRRSNYGDCRLIQGTILALTEVGYFNSTGARSPTPDVETLKSTPPGNRLPCREPKGGFPKVDGEPDLPSACFNCGNNGHRAPDCPLPIDQLYIDAYAHRHAVAKDFIKTFREAVLSGNSPPTAGVLPRVPIPRAIPAEVPVTPAVPLAQFVTVVGDEVAVIPASEGTKLLNWIKLTLTNPELFDEEGGNWLWTTIKASWEERHCTSTIITICERTAHEKGYFFQDPSEFSSYPWYAGHKLSHISAFILPERDAWNRICVRTSISKVTEDLSAMDVEKN